MLIEYQAKKVVESTLQTEKFKQWQRLSNCWWYSHFVGMEVDMFPSRHDKQLEVASTVCSGCPTQVDCLVLALTSREENGVWGGTSERDRKEIIDRVYADYPDLPKNLWSGELGETIQHYAELFVESFDLRYGVQTPREELIEARRKLLEDVEED